VTDNTNYLAKKSIPKAKEKLSAEEFLAITLVHEDLENWLSEVAQPVKQGWLGYSVSVKQLQDAESKLIEYFEHAEILPVPISWVCHDLKIDYELLMVVLESSNSWCQYMDYITRRPVRPRMRRKIQAHHMLREIEQSMQLFDLQQKYTRKYQNDQCSSRDLMIVMTDAQHLFLNMYDEGWYPISRKNITEPNARRNPVPVEGEDISNDEIEEPVTIENEKTGANTLRSILKEAGPLSFDELRESFMRRTRGNFAKSSVGPLLLYCEDIIRYSPGVYGLRNTVTDESELNRGRKVLLGEKHLLQYCRARWAGEPQNLYPLWDGKMELEWCKWANASGEKELCASLLAISSLENWPVSDLERERWNRLKAKIGVYYLSELDTPSLTETIPTYREIVATLRQAKTKGFLSWMSANRVRGNRIDDKHSISVLALLVGLGVIEAPDHWQERHSYRLGSEKIIEQFEDLLIETKRNTWPTEALKTLALHSRADFESGWLSKTDLLQFVDYIAELNHFSDSINEQIELPVNSVESDLEELIRETAGKKALRNYGLID
jgi:hypothetical protein